MQLYNNLLTERRIISVYFRKITMFNQFLNYENRELVTIGVSNAFKSIRYHSYPQQSETISYSAHE